MVDLEKQRETVRNAINTLFDIAKVQKEEIDSLKEKLAKVESGEFVTVPIDSLQVAISWMVEDIAPWMEPESSFIELRKHKPILEKAIIEKTGD